MKIYKETEISNGIRRLVFLGKNECIPGTIIPSGKRGYYDAREGLCSGFSAKYLSSFRAEAEMLFQG